MKRFECRIFAVLYAASSLFLVTRIFAEENGGNWFESLSHFPFEYNAEDAYVGSGDVQRGPNKKVSDFDENDSIVHLVFTPRTQLGVLRIGAEWERFSFGLPDHAALPDTLQSVSLVMGLDMQFSDSIIVRAEGQPGVYDTEFDNLGYDNFNLPFLIGGTYIYSPNLQLVLASRYLERLADHATNIAEDIIFWVRGLDVRHGRVANLNPQASPFTENS